jgi:hypothetical protein
MVKMTISSNLRGDERGIVFRGQLLESR